jgi:DNA-binding NarL/FixJ family response regulator
VMASQHREHAVRQALEAGVQGYLLQGCPVEEFIQGVRRVALGDYFLSRAVAQQMTLNSTRDALTGRESEVLGLIGRGYCNKSIGRELGIALGTVKTHVKAILSKLDAASRTQAVSRAVQRGLICPESDEGRGAAWPPASRRPWSPEPGHALAVV